MWSRNQIRRPARIAAAPALIAMPALAPVERDDEFEEGVNDRNVPLPDADDADDGVPRSAVDDAVGMDTMSGVVMATDPQFPKLLLQPVPQ